MSTHILFGLQLGSSNIFRKTLGSVIPFFFFQRNLLKISIAHSKKQNPLLNLLINWISPKSAPQILSIEDEYTFFKKFF